MTHDYMELGSTSPSEEDCVQVGTDDYMTKARKEARVLIRQLYREFGDAPEGAGLRIKNCPHDFGTYLEVIGYYETEEGFDWVLKIENCFPEYWDEISKLELKGEPC